MRSRLIDSGSSAITKENCLERGQTLPSLTQRRNDGTWVELKQNVAWEVIQDFFVCLF
jgi:hypothetical protein